MPGRILGDRIQARGADFAHFYSLARLSAAGQLSRFADGDLIRNVQIAVVPSSEQQWFPPAYGPQVALFLTPLGYLSYEQALVVWMVATALVYLLIVRTLVNRAARLRDFRDIARLAAIAFPPFWSLMLHGQLAVFAALLVTLAYRFLQAGHTGAAGIALGLMVYKPSLAVPIWAVLLLSGQWVMLLAATLAAIVELGTGIVAAGPGSLGAYHYMLERSGTFALQLRAQPTELHSWHNFWLLLLPTHEATALVLYALTGTLSIGLAALAWRRTASTAVRFSSLLLATVLASPHLYTYDLVILMPVWLWLTDRFLADRRVPPFVGWVLYAGYAAPLFGFATRVVPVQMSTLCYAALLAILAAGFLNPVPITSSRQVS
ncbi:MAG: glycosyltransferase family 87 protein [Vicinamibacterales bacterium]